MSSNNKSIQRVYRPVNRNKLLNRMSPYCRSSWEYQFAKWCDFNEHIVSWGFEYTVVPYYYKGRIKRYFVDFTVNFDDGRTILFEIKPSKQTKPPKSKSRKTKRYLYESETFAINSLKWQSAKQYADKKGYVFQILTEHELKKMGLRIV